MGGFTQIGGFPRAAWVKPPTLGIQSQSRTHEPSALGALLADPAPGVERRLDGQLLANSAAVRHDAWDGLAAGGMKAA